MLLLGAPFHARIDIFGYQLNNVRLLADEYAKTGNYVGSPLTHLTTSP
jgi:hypothetical protein